MYDLTFEDEIYMTNKERKPNNIPITLDIYFHVTRHVLCVTVGGITRVTELSTRISEAWYWKTRNVRNLDGVRDRNFAILQCSVNEH